MIFSHKRWRRLAAAACLVVSVLAGLGLVFRLVTPGSVEHLRTHELLAILGLLVMPWVTLWAFVADRRLSTQAAAQQQAAASEPIAAELRAAGDARAVHAPSQTPGRRADRHRRRADAEVHPAHEVAR